ncbi:MAG: nitroreductase family protein [Ruminococcaceae bacterium]|nr:nitroreductase family protein [Oscillospiraceae bacterium]
MNQTIQDLKQRRSVRQFKDEQVCEELLDIVLEAGTFAPTGMNRQSPLMVAVQNKETIEKLRKMNAAILGNPDADPFYGAPTIIVVFADNNVRTFREDGSLVIGNLCNAAHAVGLGACWIHRAKEEFETEEGKALMKEWGVAENYEGIGHCILGIPAVIPETKPRKENYIIKIK